VLVRPLTPEAVGAAVRQVLDDPAYAAAARRAAAGQAEVEDPVEICHKAATR
jgi:UDP:flavonoid glycosyltransferase YjiC (YdhE family)